MARQDKAAGIFGFLYKRWWAWLLLGSILIGIGVYRWASASRARADQIALPAAVRDIESMRWHSEQARRREDRQKNEAAVMVFFGVLLVLIGLMSLIDSVPITTGKNEEGTK